MTHNLLCLTLFSTIIILSWLKYVLSQGWCKKSRKCESRKQISVYFCVATWDLRVVRKGLFWKNEFCCRQCTQNTHPTQHGHTNGIQVQFVSRWSSVETRVFCSTSLVSIYVPLLSGDHVSKKEREAGEATWRRDAPRGLGLPLARRSLQNLRSMRSSLKPKRLFGWLHALSTEAASRLCLPCRLITHIAGAHPECFILFSFIALMEGKNNRATISIIRTGLQTQDGAHVLTKVNECFLQWVLYLKSMRLLEGRQCFPLPLC